MKLIIQLIVQEGDMMGRLHPIEVRVEKIHYQPHCTERIGNLIVKVQIIQQIKETGLVPKGTALQITVLCNGRGMLRWIWETRSVLARTSRSNPQANRNNTIGQ
jgi:hypothetical protein